MTLTRDSTPAEVQAAWATRLEEADPDRQGRRMLAPAPDKRCCLGELCDMAVEAGVIDGYEHDDPDLGPYPAVKGWVGITSGTGDHVHAGEVRGFAVIRSLDAMNDSGISWKRIAATIRAKPEGLFES